MRKGEQTRARMIATMAQLLRSKGYAAAGLNELVATAGAPKGSLYHHFPGGKEELGVAAIEAASAAIAAGIEQALHGLSTAEGFARLTAGMAKGLERSGFRDGCPLATTALETAHSSDALAAATRAGFASWTELIARRLRADGHPRAEAHARATTALAALEGGLILARAQRDTTPLRTVAQQLTTLLEAP